MQQVRLPRNIIALRNFIFNFFSKLLDKALKQHKSHHKRTTKHKQRKKKLGQLKNTNKQKIKPRAA